MVIPEEAKRRRQLCNDLGIGEDGALVWAPRRIMVFGGGVQRRNSGKAKEEIFTQ